MDKKTIMGTDYARLSLKTQAILRSVVANLPSDIQVRILQSKAMSKSHDQWFAHFKLLVTTHFPVYGEDSDDIDDIFLYTNWGDYFGCNLRVYEKKHPFLGLIVNLEDWKEDEDREQSWLLKMFEYGFIKLIKLSSHNQISQFPQIIQQVVAKINSPFVSIRCWSTLPQWRNYYFVGNTSRITAFTNMPYSETINLQNNFHSDPRSFVKKNPEYEAISYCGIYNEFAKFHEHGYDSPWDPYDGYNTD